MSGVRLGATIAFLLFLLGLSAPAQTLDLSPEADLADEVMLRNTLYVSISADDIYRSEMVQELADRQASEMLAASKRRVARQEKRIEEMRAAIETGKAQSDEMKPLMDELNRRIEVSYLALARSSVLEDIVRSARNQLRSRSLRGGRMERFDGNRPFTPAMLRAIEIAFVKQFRRALPISAEGDTALHRALGFDHRGRVDVAVSPDHPEGVWLRRYLESMRIPYYAFRTAIPGSATAPHIHIGPGSTRYRRANYTRQRAAGGTGAGF